MPAGPPLTQCPPDLCWLRPAGSPLTHARRIAADSCPPDCRWLKPTGLALTHARWPPLSLAPWIKSTCHGQECRVSVLSCPQEHLTILSCLVHRDSSGAGGSFCCGQGGHSSRLPPCRRSGSGCWGTLWVPLTLSCSEEASASKPAQEGFWFLWAVLSCLSGPGGLSCHFVLSCLFSPGGLLIPPNFPREILGG